MSATLKFANFGTGHAVSPDLYGIFFEDINFSCDGGINANMVNNYSFDGVYFSHEEQRAVSDPLRFWMMEGGTLECGTEGALHENSKYGMVTVNGKAVLSNLGYNGHKAHAEKGAMSIKAGQEYEFSCMIQNKGYEGTVKICVTADNGEVLTETAEVNTAVSTWKKVSCTVKGLKDCYGKLEMLFEGTGTLWFDCISLMDTDCWHKDDPKYRHGKFRKDLIEALQDLKPKFLRFPGGCIVEGQLPQNEYNWKDTVGELYERKSNYNLWSEKLEDGSYNQSYQIGFYEYLCLCEDLGMKPLPTLSAGLNCQIRSFQRGERICPNIPTDSEEFKTYIINNYLDLLDFAMGDPETNEWAALRARMGHPAPFVIDRIGIGNENYDEEYLKRFEIIANAIQEKYPEMFCILCGGIHPFHEDMSFGPTSLPGLHRYYEFAEKFEHIAVDEHSYHTPEWFESQASRFDGYKRGGTKVYFGEYAANSLLEGLSGEPGKGLRPVDQTNALDTALGEAAFLTGIERNSDVVAMNSYAPLFNLVDSDQWNHNLINFNPKTVCRTTNYYVQQMFACNVGSQYLPFEGELPEHVYVSVTENDTCAYVKLVNTAGEDHDLTLSFASPVAAESAVRLQNDDTTVRNELTFTGEMERSCVPTAFDVKADGNTVTVEVKKYSVSVVVLKK